MAEKLIGTPLVPYKCFVSVCGHLSADPLGVEKRERFSTLGFDHSVFILICYGNIIILDYVYGLAMNVD